MEEMQDTKPEQALTLAVVLAEDVKPLEYFKHTLGLRSEGLDPCEQSFESIVPRKEVEKVFPRKHRKNQGGGFPLKTAVGRDGKPDPGMVAFAENLLQKVYGSEWRSNPGLAFARGVIADRRGVAVNWASFAYSSQFKQMKAAPMSPFGRSGRKRMLAIEGKDEKCCDGELAGPVVRRGFRELLEDQDKGALVVRPEGSDKKRRVESAEEQIGRAEIKKRAGEEQLKELQTTHSLLQNEMKLASSKREDVASSVSGTKRKAEALRAQWFAITARIEKNSEERSFLQDSIQALFEEKKRLLSTDSATKAEEEQMTNLELEYAQEQLAINLSEGNLLQRKLASQEQIEVALRQVVESSESVLTVTTDACMEIGGRIHESAQKVRATKVVADQLASVYYLYKATDKVVVCPESIAQPSEYPEELKPPHTISIGPCPVCSRWFFCGDWVGASCGCVYHLHCAALWFQGSQKNCCKIGCEKRMHPDWLTAWGKDWDAVDELVNKELGLDERRQRWKEDANKAVDLQERDVVMSSQDSAVDDSSDDHEVKRQRKEEGSGPASPASVLPSSSASVLQEETEVGQGQIVPLPLATR